MGQQLKEDTVETMGSLITKEPLDLGGICRACSVDTSTRLEERLSWKLQNNLSQMSV